MTILAYTAQDSDCPGYVSIDRTSEGDVSVTVREAPMTRDATFICGFKDQRGESGRCTPGDDRCNNYCNMAPEVGPMQDCPAPYTQIFEGTSATFIIPAAEWPF